MPEPDVAERQRALVRLFAGYRVSLAIYAAVKLGVADALPVGPRTVGDLASALGLHRESLARLLRLLASLGLFEEREPGLFALTALGELLRADTPGSMAAPIIFGSEFELLSWQRIADAVRTGESGVQLAFGHGTFEELARPERERHAQLFDGFMSALTRVQARALLDACDLGRFTRVVDVGGGDGTLLIEVLRRHRGARGTLFDQPAVVERASARLAAATLAQRCEVVGGDFFQSVPTGGDVYMLKWIIHDWTDEESIVILRNCRAAMTPTSRMMLLERVMPEILAHASEDLFLLALADVHMLAVTGGRERTRAEFAALLARADLGVVSVTPTSSGLSAIEAKPI